MIDITTSSGNIGLNIAGVNVANSGTMLGAGIAGNDTGTGNLAITSGTITATGTGQTYGIDARTTSGNVTVNAGTTTSNANANSRGIYAVSSSGNITINATQTDGGQRGIFTGTNPSNTAGLPNLVTITSGTATANGATSPNAIVGQGKTVVINSGTATNTSTAGNSGTAILANAGTGGATVVSGTATAAGTNQSAIQIYSDGAVNLDSTIARTTTVTGSSDAINIQSGSTIAVKSGTATTSGVNSRGIFINSGLSASTVSSGTITTTGSASHGIYITPITGATVVTSDSISATGAGATGILVDIPTTETLANTGSVSITSNKITTATGSAIDVSGGSVVVSSNTITTGGNGISTFSLGPTSIKSDAVTINGSAVANSGAISATDVNSYGISITSNTIVNSGAGNRYGINAQTLGYHDGATAIVSGSITTVGDGAYGIWTVGVNGVGAMTINSTGTITTVGSIRTANNQPRYSDGIWVISGAGPITVTSNNVTTSGASSAGIAVEAGSGITSVGAPATAGTGAISITSIGAINTSGATASGINVQAGGSATAIANSGTISTSGAGSRGINVAATGGATSITSNNVATTGANAVGIYASNTGGAITIDGGTVTTANANGIFANASGLATIGATAINAAGDGQSGVFTTGGAGVALNLGTVNSTGNSSPTNGRRADAINATATAGTITGTIGSASTSGAGADAVHLVATSATGGVTLAVTGTAKASGAGSLGVNSAATTGTTSLTIANATTSGANANAVNATATTGAITIGVTNASTSGAVSLSVNAQSTAGAVALTTGTVTTSGAGSQGVFAQTTDGNITINAGSTITTATTLSGQNTSDAVFGYSTGNGAVTVTSANASTAAEASSAVGAIGGGAVSLTSGTAATTGANVATVYAFGRNAAAVTVNATTTTATGTGAYAVEAHALNGNLTLTSGTATAADGTGVLGTAGGIATVSAVSTSAKGDGQAGVSVTGGTGVVLTVGSASSTGAFQTPTAGQSGSGATSITTAPAVDVRRSDAVFAQATNGTIAATVGSATATGAGSDGIHLIANGTGGGVMLNVTGAVSASGGYGVFIDPPGANTVTIASGASVKGSLAGLDLIGGTNTIVNAGAISGTAGPGLLAAGATTLDNSGAIAGSGGVAVQLGASNDSVTLRTGSTVTGAIAGGGGTDTATLAGTFSAATASQTVANFTGFTSLTVASGYWTAPATAGSAFATATIALGASLEDTNGATGLTGVTAPSIVDNGTLVVRSGATSAGSTFGTSVVSGSGNVLLTGAGTVRLDGANSLANTGRTTIDGGTTAILTGTQGGIFATTSTGTLQIGIGGTTGGFTGTLADDGLLVISRSDDYVFGGAITGAGTITKTGAGKLTFGTNYAFTGVTNILGGSVKLSTTVAASTKLDVEGTGQLDLSGTTQMVAELAGASPAASVNIAGGSLTVNQATSTVFAGSLVGNGVLTKAGGGRLNLTGANTYTGATTVSGGTLAVNGSIVSPVTVTSGGTLGGAGSVGSVVIVSGGTYAPGNSIGSQTVNGNLTFQAGSTYQVEANAAGQADRINATGTATLAGTVAVLADPAGTYANLTSYTVLTAAGGVSGTFATVSSNLAFLTPLLAYGTNAVTLQLARNDVNFAAAATDPNQASVAAAIQSRGLGNPIYNAILMQSAAGARAAYTALSGEIHASLPTTLLVEGEAVRHAVLGRAGEGGEGVGVWGQAMYGLAEGRARQGIAFAETHRVGGIAGIDFGHEGLRFGAAGGYIDSDLGLHGRASHGDIHTKLVTGYVGWSRDALMLNGGGSYSWHDVKTRRTVTLGTIGGTQTAHYDADTAQVFGEAAYGITRGAATIAPFVGYSHLRVHREAFAETGSAVALTVGSSTRDLDIVSAGLKLYGTAPLGSATLLPHLAIAYQRYWGNTLGIEHATFAGTGTGFSVVGERTGKDALRIDVGSDITMGGRFRFGAGAFGQTSGDIGQYGGKVSISYVF